MLETLFTDKIFNYTLPLEDWIDTFVNWLQGYRGFFLALRTPVDWMLGGIDGFLQWFPPLLFIIAIFVLAWYVSGWRLGVF